MKCQDVRIELLAYLNDELSSEDKVTIENHLSTCGFCAKEIVQLQKTERILKSGLESWAEVGEKVNLTEWLQEESRKLSNKEKKKEFTKGFAETKMLKHKWQKVIRFAAVALVLVMLMASYWPQLVKASTQMPWIGPLIKQLVLRDAGLSWAYEHGYMDGSLATVEQDGVKLTVLGVIADPTQTAVIYLVDGIEEDFSVYISKINGDGAASWTSPATKTSVGTIGIAQTYPLPEGEHTLTVILVEEDRDAGRRNERLSLELVTDRENISKLSISYDLDQEVTFDDISVKAKRVVYTPTQIMVEYTVIGGTGVGGAIPQEYASYLLTESGEKLYRVRSYGSHIADGVRELYEVFERPADVSNLKMVIPVQGKHQEINIEFSEPTTIGILDTDIRFAGWVHEGNMIEIEMHYEKYGRVKSITGWSVVDEGGNTEELTIWKGESFGAYENPGDFAWVTTKYELEETDRPVKLIATQVLTIVEGNWEIILPAIN